MQKSLVTTALLMVSLLAATAGGKKIATINGVEIWRVRTAGGFFAAPTTTIVAADPKNPGSMSVINAASCPSITQQILTPLADAGGMIGASAVRRPDQTKVSQNGGGAVAVADTEVEAVFISDATATGGNGGAGGNGGNGKPGKGPKNPKPGKGPKN